MRAAPLNLDPPKMSPERFFAAQGELRSPTARYRGWPPPARADGDRRPQVGNPHLCPARDTLGFGLQCVVMPIDGQGASAAADWGVPAF